MNERTNFGARQRTWPPRALRISHPRTASPAQDVNLSCVFAHGKDLSQTSWRKPLLTHSRIFADASLPPQFPRLQPREQLATADPVCGRNALLRQRCARYNAAAPGAKQRARPFCRTASPLHRAPPRPKLKLCELESPAARPRAAFATGTVRASKLARTPTPRTTLRGLERSTCA